MTLTCNSYYCGVYMMRFFCVHHSILEDPLSGKDLHANAGGAGSIPGLGRALGKGTGCPLQCSYLENPMDRWAWQATVHGVAKELDTTLWLSTQSTLISWDSTARKSCFFLFIYLLTYNSKWVFLSFVKLESISIITYFLAHIFPNGCWEFFLGFCP